MAKIHWGEAKTKYISDETVSYRDIAREFGVNLTTVARKAKIENWTKLRTQLQTDSKQKAIERVGNTIADVNARHVEVALLLQKKGIETIKNKKPRNFDQALRSVDKGIDIERKALGIDKPTPPTGPTQQNTLINYNVFLQKYGDKRPNDKLPNDN